MVHVNREWYTSTVESSCVLQHTSHSHLQANKRDCLTSEQKNMLVLRFSVTSFVEHVQPKYVTSLFNWEEENLSNSALTLRSTALASFSQNPHLWEATEHVCPFWFCLFPNLPLFDTSPPWNPPSPPHWTEAFPIPSPTPRHLVSKFLFPLLPSLLPLLHVEFCSGGACLNDQPISCFLGHKGGPQTTTLNGDAHKRAPLLMDSGHGCFLAWNSGMLEDWREASWADIKRKCHAK